jgi:hypothetical protein
MDEYVEQTTTGLGGRLWQSIKGVALGIILFIVAFPVLWLNEGYAVKTARLLTKGAKTVIDVASDRVDPANEGKLVHVTGTATTGETVADPVFGVAAKTIRMRRKVEMYQWKETSSTQKQKNLGGSETTTTVYKYTQVWSEQPINSAAFKQQQGHQNPDAWPFSSAVYFAGDMRLGAFRLNQHLVNQFTGADPVDVSQGKVPASMQARARPMESGFQIGDPAAPLTGDLRVSFEQLKSPEVSIVSGQIRDTFEPYQVSGGTVELVGMGTQSAAAMFGNAQSQNTTRTWLLRGLGFILMFVGLTLVFSPIATLADVVPFIGGLLRFGAAVVSGVVALGLSLAIIAIAWFVYRPILSISLLVAVAICVYAVASFRRKKTAATAASHAAGA